MKTSNVTQVTTFEKLLGFCNAQGAMYNPPKDSMKVTAMNSLLTSAQQSVQAVNDLTAAYQKAVGERFQAFDALPKFMTRLLNALKAANASETTLREVSRFKKRFTVQVKSLPAQPATADSANGDPPAIKSTRMQAAYDHQVENFGMMISFVASEPAYATTEPTLTVDSLGKHQQNLNAKNKAVIDLFAALSAARKQRDKALYAKDGIYTTSKSVKHYFKSVLGTQNALVKELAAMKFVSKKRATK